MKRIILTLSVCLSMIVAVFAHEGATGVVKTRMDMMKEIARSMKSIATVLKNEDAQDFATIRASAAVIEKHSGHFAKLFPEGSNPAPSEASDRIWQKRDTFDLIMTDMGERANVLASVDKTASFEEVKTQFKALGETCGTCHKAFRIQK